MWKLKDTSASQRCSKAEEIVKLKCVSYTSSYQSTRIDPKEWRKNIPQENNWNHEENA